MMMQKTYAATGTLAAERTTGAFRTRQDARRYRLLLFLLIGAGVLCAMGLLLYNNPVPVTSDSFVPVVRRRIVALVAMLIAAVCQSLSTVAFQSVTGNRIITPSLLGFEALYSTLHTSILFFFGTGALLRFQNTGAFLLQIVLMVGLCLLLYGWLLAGKTGDLQRMLLVGIIIGTGLRSLSSFMRRLLAPSEFDILQARLFGSVNHADPAYFPVAVPLVVLGVVLLFVMAKRLNVLSLGKGIATTLGAKHKQGVLRTLVLISVLMSVSTALVGPMTFYGFLVATLCYQATPTYDHRYLFPMAVAIGFVILTASYFFMYHVFNAQGVVSVLIELFGGLTFLVVILRKGTL